MKRVRTDMSAYAGIHLPYGFYVRSLKGIDIRGLWIGQQRFAPPFLPWSTPVGDALAKLYYANTVGKRK